MRNFIVTTLIVVAMSLATQSVSAGNRHRRAVYYGHDHIVHHVAPRQVYRHSTVRAIPHYGYHAPVYGYSPYFGSIHRHTYHYARPSYYAYPLYSGGSFGIQGGGVSFHIGF